MTAKKESMFVTNDGQNVMFTFALVSSLFLLWGFCNGMIDVMDKHFQKELHLTLAQSAWVQFAHYLGYFLMAIPAGWIATWLGYRVGIIGGLLLVSAGGFWFWQATQIAEFWAFLLGVCGIAAGLTFLETVANPYTTVLGTPRYAATRINLAQSCNGLGWILGPIAGSLFFYGTDAAGRSTGAEMLWIPYVGVAVVVLILALIFCFAPVPNIKTEDDYHLDDGNEPEKASAQADRQVARFPVYVLLWLNSAALFGAIGMIAFACLDALGLGKQLVDIASRIPHPSGLTITSHTSLVVVLMAVGCLTLAILAVALIPVTMKMSHHRIWSHPHFTGATLAQFLYVAAQAGIFSFFINYMTAEVPPLPKFLQTIAPQDWVEVSTTVAKRDVQDLALLATKLKQKSDPVSEFLGSQLGNDTLEALANPNDPALNSPTLLFNVARDLNAIVRRDLEKDEGFQTLYDPTRFSGIQLQDTTQQLLAQNPTGIDRCRLNRMLLDDAYPNAIPFQDGRLSISDKAASTLLSVGFLCFLIGRFTGSGLLKKFSAHKIVGLYATLNVLMCLLVFCKLGWLSVGCVFLSFFFMSIMFPTIFALGIFGLGKLRKMASAYIVMAIMGGAILPKFMGAVADRYDMSRGFIVPMACFACHCPLRLLLAAVE